MLKIGTIFPIATSAMAPNGNIIFVDDDADPEWYDATHVRTIQQGIDTALDAIKPTVNNRHIFK